MILIPGLAARIAATESAGRVGVIVLSPARFVTTGATGVGSSSFFFESKRRSATTLAFGERES